MPNYPFPPVGALEAKGASEMNMVGVIRLLKALKCEVSVVAKIRSPQSADISSTAKAEEIRLQGVPYRAKIRSAGLHRLFRPLLWDGAANEYDDEHLRGVLREEIRAFSPDVVVLEYTFLVPLARFFKAYGIPVAIRSHNIEPLHFLSEEGFSFLNLLKFIFKWIVEYAAVRRSDFLFAITPREAAWYRRMGRKPIVLLPSGYLPQAVEKPPYAPRDTAHPVFLFPGGSFGIPHNRRAVELLVRAIAPKLMKRAPGDFTLLISGRKLPESLEKAFPECVRFIGHVEDPDELYKNVDAVIIPTQFGRGMQLKLFAPLARGFPVVTFSRVLSGYPFENGRDILLASDTETFAEAMRALWSYNMRKSLGAHARAASVVLFSKKSLEEALEKLSTL